MLTGSIFEGKYLILDILGSGGMSTVYLAQNIKLGTKWAIKEISKKYSPRIDLFIEPNILKKLNHPALPRVFDIVEDEKSIYIIVDFIEGINLDKEIKKVGVFEKSVVLGWARELCEVLDYLHKIKPNPIIYRDMKPSNIILSKDGKLKLIDFGIAREYKADSGNDTVCIGTRGYAAPEQYGSNQTNAATDIYSLGITLLELVSGIGPNEKEFESLVEELDNSSFTSFERIISKCIRLNSEERYQSIEELVRDLENYERKNRREIGTEYLHPDIAYIREAHLRKVVSFKRLIISIWGNSEFACEFAYLAAKLTDFRVLLVNLNFMDDGVTSHLSLKNYYGNTSCEYGFNEAVNDASTGVLSRDQLVSACLRLSDVDNLYILKSNFDLNNYELYKNKKVENLIFAAYKSFELVIVSVNRSLLDVFTINSFISSDYIIAPLRCDKSEIREFKAYSSFLRDIHGIQPEKIGYIAYEYNENTNLSVDEFKSEVGVENFLGVLSYSHKREAFRNLKAVYAKRMEETVKNEYREILSKYNIVPKFSFKERFNNWLLKAKRNNSGKRGRVAFH